MKLQGNNDIMSNNNLVISEVALVQVHICQALSRSLMTLMGGDARYPWYLMRQYFEGPLEYY